LKGLPIKDLPNFEGAAYFCPARMGSIAS